MADVFHKCFAVVLGQDTRRANVDEPVQIGRVSPDHERGPSPVRAALGRGPEDPPLATWVHLRVVACDCQSPAGLTGPSRVSVRVDKPARFGCRRIEDLPVPATLVHRNRSRSTPSYGRTLNELEDVGRTLDLPGQPARVKALLAGDVLLDHSVEIPGGNTCMAQWTPYGPRKRDWEIPPLVYCTVNEFIPVSYEYMGP